MSRKLVPVLDAGHGGVINGIYQTAGKRSPNWSKGVLFEGVFNRWVINRIIEKLDRANVPYYHISPEYTDVSLKTRRIRANKIYAENPDTYLFSCHANAGGGKGVEGFTTRGVTRSDTIGEKFLANIEKRMAEQKMRFDYSDNDKDKEANFYILLVNMPAFLLECGFMDQKEDYKNLWDEEYLDIIVDAIVEVMIQLYKVGI